MKQKFISNTYYRTGIDIMNILHLDNYEIAEINTVCQQYPMLINEYYLSLIDPDKKQLDFIRHIEFLTDTNNVYSNPLELFKDLVLLNNF